MRVEIYVHFECVSQTKILKLPTSIANTHCLFDFPVDSTVAETMELVNIVVSSFIKLSSLFM